VLVSLVDPVANCKANAQPKKKRSKRKKQTITTLARASKSEGNSRLCAGRKYVPSILHFGSVAATQYPTKICCLKGQSLRRPNTCSTRQHRHRKPAKTKEATTKKHQHSIRAVAVRALTHSSFPFLCSYPRLACEVYVPQHTLAHHLTALQHKIDKRRSSVCTTPHSK